MSRLRRPNPRSFLLLLLLIPLSIATACRTAGPVTGRPGEVQRGVASWYGEPFHGRFTASGEVYDMHQLTAAHRTLPFQTLVEVTNLDNGRRVTVRVTDRGPFVRGRVIDLSRAAAAEIGMIGPGIAQVELRVLGPMPPAPQQAARRGSEAPQASAAAATGFTVQVGAFQDPLLAEALRREVARRFAGAVVRSDGQWHRVQVGDFPRRARAERLRRRLERHGYHALVATLP
ncbi:MAG TPA: septal ring lytic transglycosylase RlpA family protein [Thermoanaerobaculia bacterium]|nr:septal ring lytic transglycosylase RlpA family protein [Thermoanaerobaculia bacterium]